MESIIVHPDKIEVFLPNTVRNAEILSACFHDLARAWTSRWDLKWRDFRKASDAWNRWKSWEIVGTCDLLEITAHGHAYHVQETDRGLRTFSEPHWISNPFPNPNQLGVYFNYRHLGWLRVTDCRKNDPLLYTDSVFDVLRDIAGLGVLDFPRRIEIAMDIPDVDLARELRLSLRLRRSNPRSLVHFLPGLQGHIFHGPGMDGDREYEHFFGYVTDGIRQLAFYPRWPDGFYRIELRMGPRSLRRYIRSHAFQEIRDPEIRSTTLAVLATMQTLTEKNIIREGLDLPRLHTAHPSAKGLGLEHLSIRGQRYRLVGNGLSLEEINQYSVRLPMPPMTIIKPIEVGGLLRGTVNQSY